MDRARIAFIGVIGVAAAVIGVSAIVDARREVTGLRATISALEVTLAQMPGPEPSGPGVAKLEDWDPAIVAPALATSTGAPTLPATIPPTATTGPPTNTPLPPTATPIPSPTPTIGPAPGTILEVGQTWRQGAVELTVYETRLHTNGIEVRARLRNRTANQISIKFNLREQFSAVDNRAVKLRVQAIRFSYPTYFGDTYEEAVVIDPDAVQEVFQKNYRYPFITVDTTDPQLSEVVLTVTGVSSVVEARWSIPVHH